MKTETTIDLPGVSAKSDGADFLRELIEVAAQRLLDIEVSALCGSGHAERNRDRDNQRNGGRQREREWPFLWLDATYAKLREVALTAITRTPKVLANALLKDGRQRSAVPAGTTPALGRLLRYRRPGNGCGAGSWRTSMAG